MSDKVRPKLILTVGLPRSGKTTWAREQGKPIVNPDSIRLALHGQRFLAAAEPWVWAIAITMVRSLFLAGNNIVIVDATNNSKKRRDFWTDGHWQIVYHTFNASKDLCIERAKMDNDADIIPVIERMDAEFEPIDEARDPA